MNDNTPILVGGGQLTQRGVEPAAALEPVGMMAECARRAADNAGVAPNVLSQLDKIAVVNIIGWHYANAPRLVGDAVGARPAQQIYTAVGGNTPQWLVNQTADEIASGKTRFALIAGAEAIDSVVNARKAGVRLDWTKGGEGTPVLVGDERQGSSTPELQHGLVMPTSVYPLFENGLRAHYGLSLDEHRRRLGELCARMTATAARHPGAWFPRERSADELATVTADNRMIAFPYPKLMNAIINVDQAAAVLMTSVGAARALGIPESRWVFVHGGAEAHDIWFPTERVNFHSSPAIRRIGEEALQMAQLTIDDIDLFDIYSCFPSALQIGRDMLGIAADDPRSLTVTGGLPYHGGPGNNYVTHSIATMIDRLREQPGKHGLVTGLGWYLTKHSVGIYSTQPPVRAWQRPDSPTYQADIDAQPHPTVLDSASGPASIETYTVVHERDGSPSRGIVVARLDDARRVIANTPADRELLESLEAREAIGRTGTLRQADGLNIFDPQ